MNNIKSWISDMLDYLLCLSLTTVLMIIFITLINASIKIIEIFIGELGSQIYLAALCVSVVLMVIKKTLSDYK